MSSVIGESEHQPAPPDTRCTPGGGEQLDTATGGEGVAESGPPRAGPEVSEALISRSTWLH